MTQPEEALGGRLSRLEGQVARQETDLRDHLREWREVQSAARAELTAAVAAMTAKIDGLEAKINSMLATVGRPNYQALIGVGMLTLALGTALSGVLATIGGLALSNLRSEIETLKVNATESRAKVQTQIETVSRQLAEHANSPGHAVALERTDTLQNRVEVLEQSARLQRR